MSSDQVHGATELFQAQCHIYKHMYYFVESMSLKCAVQLGIPDIIHKHNQPITLQHLVSALNVSPTKANCLQRLLRILVHSGFFATAKIHDNHDEEGYVLTSSSKLLLLEDGPTSLTSVVLAMLDPVLVAPWFSLGDWFKGDELTAFETYHGNSFCEYMKQNHEFMVLLSEALASDSRLVRLVVEDHKEIFDGVVSLVDVGGSTGTFTRSIADAYPDMKCRVLDLPQVVANMPETNNLKFIGGDMFRSIPCADAILIKSVMLNWSDEDCLKILKKCREAIPSKDEGGKLILIEMVINDNKDESEAIETRLFVDIALMLICSGRGRNEKEWGELFVEAGFSNYKVTATCGIHSIIEVYP